MAFSETPRCDSLDKKRMRQEGLFCHPEEPARRRRGIPARADRPPSRSETNHGSHPIAFLVGVKRHTSFTQEKPWRQLKSPSTPTARFAPKAISKSVTPCE